MVTPFLPLSNDGQQTHAPWTARKIPLEEVSKLLGHESIKTTERHYSKWMKGRQDRLGQSLYGYVSQEEISAWTAALDLGALCRQTSDVPEFG